MNKAILVGRLTADPELKATTSGVSVCSFSVAVNRRFARAGEERKADFINCVAWRQTAEFICNYFAKGRMIGLVGSIQTRDWTDNEGRKRYADGRSLSMRRTLRRARARPRGAHRRARAAVAAERSAATDAASAAGL